MTQDTSIHRGLVCRMVALVCIVLLLNACSSIDHTAQVSIPSQASWAVVPFHNQSQSPQAGIRAATITAGLLRVKGLRAIRFYPSQISCKEQIDCVPKTLNWAQVQRWARQKHVRYIVTGAVTEWRYKVGLDGEPVVGLVLKLKDLNSGQVLWSAVGSKIGSSRSGLSYTGQNLIASMLSSLRVTV